MVQWLARFEYNIVTPIASIRSVAVNLQEHACYAILLDLIMG